ncbi:UBP-type zinc finger domain-containing protein [Nonomuraea endophytica]|uniref:UBP-type zinc finger domain-containing protein n=1 Tax=Nonomuraea endophytica TaxID=714136 RepID=UPI0037C6B4DB
MPLEAEGPIVIVRAGPNGQAPRCEHADELKAVEYRSAECPGCLARGQTWTRLTMCLSCGWVACSDGSWNGHARAHYQETDHPVAAALGPPPISRWCYVHRRTV